MHVPYRLAAAPTPDRCSECANRRARRDDVVAAVKRLVKWLAVGIAAACVLAVFAVVGALALAAMFWELPDIH